MMGGVTDRPPKSDVYGPMPELGTKLICQYCLHLVELKQAESGWHFWCAPRDPVDGRHRCLGGVDPTNRYTFVPRTLHLPEPAYDDQGRDVERWYPRYTPEGVGRFM